MSEKVYLFGRWWKPSHVLFGLCPAVMTVGFVLDWMFGVYFPTLIEWVIGGTEG